MSFARARRVTVMAGAMVAAMTVAACGGSTSSSSSQTTTAPAAATGSGTSAAATIAPYLTEPTGIPALPSLPKRPPTGKVIYYINTGGAGATEYVTSIRAATQALGWRFVSLTYNVTSPTSGNSAYLSAVNAGASGIVSTGLPAAAVRQGISTADAKGIPVVLLNPNEPLAEHGFYEVGDAHVTAPQQARIDALAIEADATRTGKPAHVGIISSSGIPALSILTSALSHAVQSYCTHCTASMIDVSAADLVSGQAPKDVVSYIQSHRDINYVDVAIGSVEGGMRAALNAAGMNDVKIEGLLPGPAQNQEIRSGASLFWLEFPVGFVSWEALDSVARAVTGGNPGIHTSEPVPLWLVQKSNLSFNPSQLPDFPIGYQAQFKRLWHVS